MKNLPDEGLVQLKWKGQTIRGKYGDVRRFMEFTALVFGIHTCLDTAHYGAVNCLSTALSKMRVSETMTIGFTHSNHRWQATQSTKQHQAIAFAIEFLLRNVFNAAGVIATRVGRGFQQFKLYQKVTATTLIWWTDKIENHSVFETNSNSGFQTKSVVGDHWKDQNYIQLLMAPGAGIELSHLRDPDLNLNDNSSQDSREADASGRTSEIDPDRMSTIHEEDDVAPDWFN